MEIIHFKKYEVAIFVRKKLKMNMLKIEKKCEVRDHEIIFIIQGNIKVLRIA